MTEGNGNTIVRAEAPEVLGNRILVEPIETKKTPGGVLLPEGLQKKGMPGSPSTGPTMEARVVRVGPGRETETGHLIEMTVKPGDSVWIAAAYAVSIERDGLIYYATEEDNVLAWARG